MLEEKSPLYVVGILLELEHEARQELAQRPGKGKARPAKYPVNTTVQRNGEPRDQQVVEE